MKKFFIPVIIVIIILLLVVAFKTYPSILEVNKQKNNVNPEKITGLVIQKTKDSVTILHDTQKLTFKIDTEFAIGSLVELTYVGKIKDKEENQNCQIVESNVKSENYIPDSYLDNGLFSDYYYLAYQKLQSLSLEEKIAQTLIVHYPSDAVNVQKKYQFGGYIFFKKDFDNKTKADVQKMLQDLNKASNIPILTAIDEEGGKVSRISSNANLVSEPFKSPQELYQEGGLSKIKEDVINKSAILKELGLNLNLAPVVDVSTDPNNYIYNRTLGLGTNETSEYAKTVIAASKNTGVSYTLKHFPGYGNNLDTHKTSSLDYKSYDEIMQSDIHPFKAGIDAGAEAVMVSHNTVVNIDKDNPSSLSKKIHDILRDNLNYTGVIITDDLNMSALKNIANIEVKALLAGNDLLITSDYANSYKRILDGINKGLLKEEELNQRVFKVLAWKYYKKLI